MNGNNNFWLYHDNRRRKKFFIVCSAGLFSVCMLLVSWIMLVWSFNSSRRSSLYFRPCLAVIWSTKTIVLWRENLQANSRHCCQWNLQDITCHLEICVFYLLYFKTVDAKEVSVDLLCLWFAGIMFCSFNTSTTTTNILRRLLDYRRAGEVLTNLCDACWDCEWHFDWNGWSTVLEGCLSIWDWYKYFIHIDVLALRCVSFLSWVGFVLGYFWGWRRLFVFCTNCKMARLACFGRTFIGCF